MGPCMPPAKQCRDGALMHMQTMAVGHEEHLTLNSIDCAHTKNVRSKAL